MSSLPSEALAENIPLFLPSALPPHIRNLPELSEICQLERRLREPQADDAIAAIQRQRRVIQGLWQFKRLNASGTGNKPNTRMLTLYKRFDDKTKRAVEEYRAAWRALRILDPDGWWSIRLKELKDQDVRGPGKDPNDTSTSNSRYEPSWIWLVPRATGLNGETGEDEFNESMRVEWAKARARMMRWREELLIVQEEMRRVLVYLSWRAEWWRERSSLRTHDDGSVLSGVSGYANKQAAICSRMVKQLACYWLPRLAKRGVMPSWVSDFEALLPDPLTVVPPDVQSEGAGNDIEGLVDADEDCTDNSEDEDCNAGGDDDGDFDWDD